MLSLERFRQRQSPIFIGALPALREVFAQAARQTRKTTKSEERVDPNFLLIDTFTHDVVRAQEENPLEESERRARLEKTLEAQLEAALREHLRTPYHTDANEIDWERYAAGQLRVFHRHYHQKDLRDHCQEAIDANTGAKRARYEREKAQMDALYSQHILPELEHPDQLVRARAEILSWEVRRAYGLKSEDEIFVGKKHGLVMPANQEVYPDGFSYINIHQLVYIPSQEKILVTIDQFFAELSYSQHAHILKSWKRNALPETKPVTEKLLMETIVPLPEAVRLSPAFPIFLQVAQLLDKSEIEYRQKQQYSHSFVSHSSETLHLTSAFLAHILLLEYQVCLQFPQAVDSLSQRLQVAFEMAAHPLLSGQGFSYQASLQAYSDQFLQSWLKHPQKTNTQRPAIVLRQTLESPAYRSATRQGRLAPEVQVQRNKALLQLSATYPDILNSFLSQAQCAVGSVGGLTRMGRALNSPLGARILGGHNASFSEIRELIGNRAERWSRGVCVNPDCRMMTQLNQQFGGKIPPHHLPFVGECRLCMHCELQYQQKNSPSRPDSGRLDQFGRQTFSSAGDAAREYLNMFGIQPDLLPTFFLAESHVLQ